MLVLSILAFSSTFLADFAWSNYTMAASKGDARRAAVWSMAIVVIGSGGLAAFMISKWMVIPEAIGAFCGTYLAVRRG